MKWDIASFGIGLAVGAVATIVIGAVMLRATTPPTPAQPAT